MRAGGLQDDHQEVMQTRRSDGYNYTVDKLATLNIFF